VIVDGEIGRIETGQVPGDPFPEIDLRVDSGFNF